MDKHPTIAKTKTSKRIQSIIDRSSIVKATVSTRRFKRLNTNIQKNQKKFFNTLGIVTLVLAILGILKFILAIGSIGFAISLTDLGLSSIIFLVIHTLILGFFVMIYLISSLGIIRRKSHTPYYSHILFMTALLIFVINIVSIFIGNTFIIYNGRGSFLDLLLVYFIMIIIIENKEHFHK